MTEIPLDLGHFMTLLEEANQDRFDDLEWEFNDGQRDAIRHGEGPLWVTAGPGSGKSEVLISRALKLLLVDGVPPKGILITTFTEKAATNLEERIVDRLQTLGFDQAVDASEVRVGTLHSLCNDIMQEYRYPDYANVELLDENGQQLFMHDNCKFVKYLAGSGRVDEDKRETLPGEFGIENGWEFFEPMLSWGVSEKYGPNQWQATNAASQLFDRVSQYRADTETLIEDAEGPWRVCAEGLEKYRETLRENSRCDFARLLERFIEFLDSPSGRRFTEGDAEREQAPLQHVLVDEYQDTNPLQQELYFELTGRLSEPNIAVVGDDDQALYRFRGGTVECLIRFPERAERRLGASVEQTQLKTNYRSTHDIVSWCNRYIGEHPTMEQPGARAPGKEAMVANRDDSRDETSVRGVIEGSVSDEPAAVAAELVEQLHEEGYIEDYSQVAFLFKSTKETDQWAGPYVEALREKGIPVYNPRNKAFLKQDEIRLALGALVRCLDPNLEGANTVASNERSRVRKQIERWHDDYEELVVEYGATDLHRYVSNRRSAISQLESGESFGYSFLEQLYRILMFHPFQEWIESPENPERGQRLGELSKLFDSFVSITGERILKKASGTESVSTAFLGRFYWLFCGYLEASDFDEPEDPYNQIPEGFVQIMTVHQAKGLEFPIVFTSDLDSDPWMSGTYWIENELAPFADINPEGVADDRAERDEIRRFYVAYSRTEENLFLLDTEDAPSPLSLGYDERGNPLDTDWFQGDRRIRAPEEFIETVSEPVGPQQKTELKRRYSITGDVLAYRRCRRQYGYYKEMSFAPVHATQLFFGRVIHETLDRAHRHYRGDIEGIPQGKIPDADEIARYFGEVAESLKNRNVIPMSDDAEVKALEYVQRFNEREGENLYPRVLDTEFELQSSREEFVLEGVVDVLTGRDGSETEIWDYKAGKRPDVGAELNDYRAQLRTYAQLYAANDPDGNYPDRGVIYFLGEDSREEAMFELTFDDDEVVDSLSAFEDTVEDIEQSRERGDWFSIDSPPSEKTCVECDIRFNCPARPEYRGQLE